MARETQNNAFAAGEGQEPTCAVPYGDFVDWDKRLNREGPFFRDLFRAVGVHSVIDVGAGSARHAILFASWGLAVDAVDPSESMLAEAEENLSTYADNVASGGGSVVLTQAGFGDLARLGLGPADAVVCTGNALPHVGSVENLRTTLADFASVLRPGGVLVLHLLNHTRLAEKRTQAIAPKVRESPDGLRVFLRVIDYPQDGASFGFDFVTLTRDSNGEWDLDSRRSSHTALGHDLLVAELEAAGFGSVELLGDHTGRALDVLADESVIVVARKA